MRPQLRWALLVTLAANLWLAPAIAIAAGIAAVTLPLGLACTAVLAAYLVSMGLDAETVALSPFGPSQSGRFYGVNNLLETMLLVPALVGAARLGRAGVAVAALAFVTIGGARFGADGGGIVVLAAAYLVLFLRLRDSRPTPQLVTAVAAGAVAWLLLPRSMRRPGAPAVTDAVGGGVALAGDVADRIELSVRRTAAGLGATIVVLGSLATLILVAIRAKRDPVLDAFLVAIAVSLVVNDTPGDVLGMGAAIAIALARHSPLQGALSSPSMRRAATLLAVLALIALPVGLAGCGGGEEVSPTPETVVGSLPAATTAEATTTEGSGSELKGDPANGEKVFASAGCGGCHTLDAAGSSGNVGPNLDDAKPDLALALNRVTNGSGAMPSFKGQLSDQEIADVAAYVVESTQG